MTDFIDMTKAELAAALKAAGIELTASQIKKTSHADLVQMAGEQARPTEPNLIKVLDNSDALHASESPDAAELDDNRLLETLATLTPAEQHLLVAFAHCENNVTNGAPKHAKVASDLATWVWLDDRKVGDMTVKQKKGVLSSLVKKSLVTVTPDSEGDLIGFTDAGFDAVMALLDDELPEITTAPKADKKAANVVAMPTTKKARVLEDRVLLQPGKVEDVKPTKEGSKRALLIQALSRGCTLEHLESLLGWNRSTVSSAIRTDVGAIGLGVERKGDKYFLLLPEGMKALPVREATATREEARVAACK